MHPEGESAMSTISVRYIVNDVDAAITFYSQLLGFTVEAHPAPGFAMLSRGALRLLLRSRQSDRRRPEPGGWNRIQLHVPDLDTTVEKLRSAGAHFRNDIVIGNGGKQILLDDPSGNPLELFEQKQA